ncbi:hypothetical protein TYRP_005663 [Tyrophagus putrescentiae]|nr:hypothetical protein TYRP_005663 [Tyrophagus putrescentiae]
MHFLKSKLYFSVVVVLGFFLLPGTSSESSVDENQEWTLHSYHPHQQKPPKPSKPSSPTVGKDFCHFEGLNYPPGARMVARSDPCIACFCRNGGRAECYRQNCPPAPVDCTPITSQSNLCPSSAYNCSIPERHQSPAVIRLLEGPNSAKSRFQLFGQRRRSLPLVAADCLIRGIAYRVGETVGVASSNCLHCYCARQSLLCVPLCCYEPLLQTTSKGRESRDDQQAVEYHRAVHRREPHPLAYL